MSNKDINGFIGLMKKADKVGDSCWKATTAKRITLVIPDGIQIFDTDLNKVFVGDGVTCGGVSSGSKKKIRKIGITAASGVGLTATTSGTTNSITWPLYGDDIRTGDAITLAVGSGTLPSGVTAGSYYVIKNNDVGDGASNIGTSFKLATTRANALARTSVSILSSGVPGWTAVISGISPTFGEDVILIDPVSAAVDIYLPDANSASGFSITVKRGKTATNNITIKELDASGNVSASGSFVCDDTAGNIRLKAATDDYINLFADSSVGEYWSNGKQITA